jgi:hypothetical protein
LGYDPAKKVEIVYGGAILIEPEISVSNGLNYVSEILLDTENLAAIFGIAKRICSVSRRDPKKMVFQSRTVDVSMKPFLLF